jgi:hypothetical protein
MITIVPVPREQYLLANETQIRSRALPIAKPDQFAKLHLSLIEIIDDLLDTHRKAITSHTAAAKDLTDRGLISQANNRELHAQNHRELITGLHLLKLYHLDRLDQSLSV